MSSLALLVATQSSTEGSDTAIESFGDVITLLKESILGLVEGFIAELPIMLIGLVVLAAGMFSLRFVMRAAEKAMSGETVDESLRKLTLTFVQMTLQFVVIMMALSVAGIDVGAALAAMGLLGLAFAFAFQNILENFIAGILILMRKPFKIGDQIIAGDHEGTVVDINMRITKLHSYEGVSLLLPNADVFRNPLVNLTEQGKRRTSVMIGIDYRDDHDAVGELVRRAVSAVEGVLSEPEVEVLCTDLGSSSVDFELRYWSAPDIRTVRHTRDRAIRAAKTAVEANGMTIPWPIRTLEPGAALRVTTSTD